MSAAQGLERRARWRWPEFVFWLVAFGALLMPSGKYLILNEIAILALFALSLDLILGYAGIVSLGHAAFFGVGAYTAGLVAKHVTGDPLAGLAAAIAAATIVGFLTSFLVLRGSDLKCRYGGEEFLIVLPDTEPHVAMRVAERARASVCAPMAVDNVRMAMSVSLGVASTRTASTCPDGLIQAADAALYRAKADGRNCVST